MKFVIAALLGGGGALVALPSPGVNECEIVSAEVSTADPTLINPTPAAESLQIVVYCGHQVATDSGGIRTERALKIIDVDVDQATVLVEAAGGLLDDGDVFVGSNS